MSSASSLHLDRSKTAAMHYSIYLLLAAFKFNIMRFYKERHVESKFGIGLKHKWFWIRVGKWSSQINAGSIDNC